MKTFKQLISEVQEPQSEGEKNFKGLHNPINHKDLVPGVTDQEHVFNGSPQRKDPRTASYEDKASEEAYDKTLKVKNGEEKKKGTQTDLNMEEETSLDEKTLTSAEMKKREEIVKALKRKGMEKSKAYAIATATAKKVAEEAEQIDEISKKTAISAYAGKVARDEYSSGGDFGDKIHTMITKKWGKKAGQDAEAHASSQTMGRGGKSLKTDPLSYATKSSSMRTTKSGVLNKQDTKAKGNEIKSRLGSHAKAKLPEEADLDEAYGKRVDVYAHERNDDSHKLSDWSMDKLDKFRKIPHGSHSKADIEAEHKRRMRTSEYEMRTKDPVKEAAELEEARRGRPRKDGTKPEGDEEGGREHIIMQLRKVVNLRGQKKVEFNDDSKHDISVDHAKKALAKHDSMHRAADKQAYAEKLAKSHDSFKSTVSEAIERRYQDIDPEEGSADSTTMRSDRGAMKTYTTIGRDGRVKLIKHISHAKEVKIGESKDMTPANMEKEIKHDCAKHVLHKEWGEGETVEGMHTIVETAEGEGYVTHYDVMFEHGIEQNVPVEDLEIKTMVEHWHKNYKPKGKMKEGKEHTVPKSAKEKDLAALAEPKDKITHKDVLVGRGVIKKAVKEAVNMQSDSLKKLKKDPAAGENIKTDLPPTQGNKPVGGEGDPSRVGGKYSVEEEKLMKLYDSLSEENKSKFEQMIDSEEGIEQLLAFAEEQGF